MVCEWVLAISFIIPNDCCLKSNKMCAENDSIGFLRVSTH